MGETLEFSLKLKTIPVILENVQGEKKNYTLSEMNGEKADEWQDFTLEKMDMSPEGEQSEDGSVKVKVKIGNSFSMTGMESKLLSMCLYGPDNVLVTEKEIQKFPVPVRADLFVKAQEINGLDAESKKKIKND